MENSTDSRIVASIENKYEALFHNMLNAFALHKIIVDDNGLPTDYEFIDVNESFEKMTGFKKENILGRRVTEVIPDISHDKANWIGRYGKVSLTGVEERFEDQDSTLHKWFSVYAYSPARGYFATIFDDITDRKLAVKALHEKIEELETLNKLMIGRELDMIKMKEELSKIRPEKSAQ